MWQRIDSVPAARALLANAVLRREIVPAHLGTVTLRPSQRAGASRIAELMRIDGGAMLADPVGLGKTYTALAVAAAHTDFLVVAPSSLRSMWRDALSACGLAADIVTHESLSRGRLPLTDATLLIIDEAHRFRSPAARRYALLADLCRRRSVLLLTATPIQNRRTDLSALLALFLGRRAWEMTEEQLVEYVVRSPVANAAIPRQRGPLAVPLATRDDCLDRILALPPPVPARDESVAATLLAYGLMHQWTSSRAALLAALRRRQARAVALVEALAAGRSPTRQDLAAWTHCGDSVQLAFAEIVSSETTDAGPADELLPAIERHAAALDSLVASLRSTPDPDDERAELLRRIRADHPGERIIAFCHYLETVTSLRARLRRDPGIAALTARGAQVAGGRVSRDVVLAQFRPGARDVPPAERIDLLLTTDLLSEGLNLQEASVIVHLDFPWNPARLDQRVGRARRLGSRHAEVTVYAVAPPADAERVLQIERRLRDKVAVAQRTIGVAGTILPSPLLAGIEPHGAAERRGVVDARLRDWLTDAVGSHGGTTVVAIEAAEPGFLCAVRVDGAARLVAQVGGRVGDSAEVLAAAIDAVGAAREAVAVDDAEVQRAITRVTTWLDTQRGAAAVDFTAAAAARSRRQALERVARAMARAPRHRRAQLADLAAAARHAATAPLGEGAERILETLIRAELPDEAWLRSIATFGEINARPAARRDGEGKQRPPEIAVLVLFGQPGL